MAFLIIAPSGRDHTRLLAAMCRVWDEAGRLAHEDGPTAERTPGFFAAELVTYREQLAGATSGVVMLRLDRTAGWWRVTAVGAPVDRASWARWAEGGRVPGSRAAAPTDRCGGGSGPPTTHPGRTCR